jgi:sporulation protein YunB
MKRRSFKKMIIILLVIFIFVIYIIIDNAVRPAIFSLAELRLQALANEAVNEAIDGVFESGISYSDLISIEKNENGMIVMLSANTININYFASGISSTVQEKIVNIGEQGIDIPIGTIIGGSFFSGRGPSVNVRVEPLGYVNTEFLTEFEDAGMNQTRHKIFLGVGISMRIMIANEVRQVDYSTKQLVTDTVIVGEIPEQYMQLGRLGGTQGLAPLLLMDEYMNDNAE